MIYLFLIKDTGDTNMMMPVNMLSQINLEI